MRTQPLDPLDATAFVITPVQNLIFCTMVGMVVIGTSMNLALRARRGALARLALNGAAPAQIVGTVMVQLMVVSLVSSLIGARNPGRTGRGAARTPATDR